MPTIRHHLSTAILAPLRSASPAQWLRFAVVANEVRGLETAARMAGELGAAYRAGWQSVLFVAANLDRVPLLWS